MSGFSKFPPPPPLTHRQQWAALLTAGAAVITAPALWGAHGFARHFFVIVGLVIVLLGALGFIRDWHMPFVRNRAEDPGIVDRKRAKAKAVAEKKFAEERAELVQMVVEQQLKNEQIKAYGVKMKEKFWESQHGMLSQGWALNLNFFIWAEPPVFTDESMLVGFPGSCVVRRGDEEFHSSEVECGGQRGYAIAFPEGFNPRPTELAGDYEVEWTLPDERRASRGSFTLNEHGQPQ
jgi:hypothetical protein